MKRIAAGVFRAKCLALMDEVCRTKQPIVITKRGKPVVKIVPPEPSDADIFGWMAHEVEIVGDIESPPVPLEHWHAAGTPRRRRSRRKPR